MSEGSGHWRIVLPAGVAPAGLEMDVIWRIAVRENLSVHRLTHRRDSLEEIFLKAVGHLAVQAPSTPARQEVAADGRL